MPSRDAWTASSPHGRPIRHRPSSSRVRCRPRRPEHAGPMVRSRPPARRSHRVSRHPSPRTQYASAVCGAPSMRLPWSGPNFSPDARRPACSTALSVLVSATCWCRARRPKHVCSVSRPRLLARPQAAPIMQGAIHVRVRRMLVPCMTPRGYGCRGALSRPAAPSSRDPAYHPRPHAPYASAVCGFPSIWVSHRGPDFSPDHWRPATCNAPSVSACAVCWCRARRPDRAGPVVRPRFLAQR